jgi:ABC-type Na+ efflux pump permease subunit
MRRILYLAQAEVLHVIRDRATLAQVLIVPIIQLLILSNAATFEIRDSDTYLVDLDRSSLSRGLVTRLEASGHFRIRDASASLDAANEALLAGDVTMALVIPADFEESIVRGGQAPIELSLNAEKGRPPASSSPTPSASSTTTPRRWRGRAASSRGRRSTCACAAGTTPRSTTSTTWCPASWWR